MPRMKDYFSGSHGEWGESENISHSILTALGDASIRCLSFGHLVAEDTGPDLTLTEPTHRRRSESDRIPTLAVASRATRS
jgi:hypothetical protein